MHDRRLGQDAGAPDGVLRDAGCRASINYRRARPEEDLYSNRLREAGVVMEAGRFVPATRTS